VLIVDDDRATVDNLGAVLTESGYEVLGAHDGAEAIGRLESEPVEVVVSDIRMGAVGGIDLLEHTIGRHPEVPVILVTGYGTIESAVEAMRKGAFDYVPKPVNVDKLELLIEKAIHTQKLVAENVDLRRQLSEKYSFGNIVGRSRAIQQLFAELEQIAGTNATVLIRGESGTGKELIASALHFHSARSEGPFIKVNCVAFAEGLVESELFGHEKGAFTGAHKGRKGRVEMAHGGTLFLDEIGDLALSTQLKLLRVLQEREIERVGGNATIPVDIRLIAATNRNLEKDVEASRFREELYYRIKVVTLDVPPLRDRTDDIPLLADHFVAVFNREHGKSVRGFSQPAMQRMAQYSWPGNVRELRNTVESLVVMARSPILTIDDLPPGILELRDEPTISVRVGTTIRDAEQQLILATLRMSDGNKARAARRLGIGKKTLYRKLKEYGVFSGEDPSDQVPD